MVKRTGRGGAESQHEQASNGEPNASHDEWGEVLNGDADGEIGGAPEDVNQCKGDDDVEPPGRINRSHGIVLTLSGFKELANLGIVERRVAATHF